MYSFSIAVTTNYHKISGLKQYRSITSSFIGQRCGLAWILLLQVSQDKNQGVGRLMFLFGSAEGESTFRLIRLWQKSVPCGCQTEVPISLLARLFSVSRYHPHCLASGSLPPSSHFQWCVMSSDSSSLFWPLLPHLSSSLFFQRCHISCDSFSVFCTVKGTVTLGLPR